MLIRLHRAALDLRGRGRFGPVDLEAAEGDRIVLLGPDGDALFGLLSGKRQPSEGMVRFVSGGRELTEKEKRRSVCLIPREGGLWDEMTVWENLLTLSRIFGLSRAGSDLECSLAVERCGLEMAEDIPFGKLPPDWRKMTAVASALVVGASAAAFMEPDHGLNPRMALRIAGMISTVFPPDMTVIVRAASVSGAEWMGRRFILAGGGRILFDGGEDALKHAGMSDSFGLAAERILREATK
ncbi:MAG: hypothetical protein IKI84_04920 [Clostridia bacterium]|nr:hypothetical protein [Clostridia bacterium]